MGINNYRNNALYKISKGVVLGTRPCRFCPKMLQNLVFFLAKNEKDRQMSRFPGRDICGAVKNLGFLTAPIRIIRESADWDQL